MKGKSVQSFVQLSLRRFGYEIDRTRPRLVTFLQSRNVDVVFDVGGNEGQFGLWLRRQGYRGHIVSFEPIRSAFETLKTHADHDKAWEAYPIALGAAPGKSVINVAEYSVFSSLLPHRSAATTFDARS